MRVISFSYITLALALAASAAPVIDIDSRSESYDGDLSRRDDVAQLDRRIPPAGGNRPPPSKPKGPGGPGSRKGPSSKKPVKPQSVNPGKQELALLNEAQKDGGNAGFQNVLKAEEQAQGN